MPLERSLHGPTSRPCHQAPDCVASLGGEPPASINAPPPHRESYPGQWGNPASGDKSSVLGRGGVTEGPEARGRIREVGLPRSAYFTDEYFSLPQLFSLAHQIHAIYKCKPSSVLEVGLGNGFVSTFLRRAGLPVTTVDVNPELSPDICSGIDKLVEAVEGTFDLVVCCEVLEHLPIEDLDPSLDQLRAVGKRLFLTLPTSHRPVGFGGLLRLPKLGARMVNLNFDIPIRRSLGGGPHFWEVGYDSTCTRSAIKKRLSKRFTEVRSGRFALNPYHMYFYCE
jgi:hypothetical protein